MDARHPALHQLGEPRRFTQILVLLQVLDDLTQRPLRAPDGVRFEADRRVFHVDRADPFAARFDDVLAPVGDPHEPVGVDRRDIAGMEPAIGLDRGGGRLLILEIAADDPRPPY